MTEEPQGATQATTPAKPSRLGRYRILLVVLLFAGLYAVGKLTGLMDEVHPDSVRETVGESGAWGVLLYVLLFAGGELIHIPGMVFVAAAVLAWGGVMGYVVALLASILSVTVSFLVVRTVGGRAFTTIERPFVKRMLARLDRRPITTIVLLRLVFWISPPLTYALALTGVRYRDYLVGSALGLVLPVLGMCLLFEVLL